MELKSYILILTTLVVLTLVATLEGSLYCFRRYKAKKGQCAGHMRKFKSSDPRKCCRKGMGYAVGLNKIRKNRFECMPCPTKTTVTPPTTTTEEPGWSEWSDCSVSCGAGWRSRYKLCRDCDRNNQENVKSEPCMMNYYCPVDGNWGPWFPWESCTVSCGGGVRQRDRRCNYPPPTHGGEDCQGEGREDDSCNDKDCPVDGQWGPWSPYSLCSVTCGYGEMRRSRECNNPSPQGHGANCRGLRDQRKRCSTRHCPIHGGWSLWTPWGQCAVTCGEGVRQRTRQCNTPTARFGGRKCKGEGTEQTPCDADNTPCPVNGGWGSWTNWGHCRAHPCERGIRYRTRSCDNPRPRHRGRQCRGNHHEERSCINMEDCPTEGQWCEWNDWSPCTATCVGLNSMQVRQRVCQCPAPIHGGPACEGRDFAVRDCVNMPDCNPYASFIGTANNEEDECDPSVQDSGDDSGASACSKKMTKEVETPNLEKSVILDTEKSDIEDSGPETKIPDKGNEGLTTEQPQTVTND